MEVSRNENRSDGQKEYFHCQFEVCENNEILANADIYINRYHFVNKEPAATIGSFCCCENYLAFELLINSILKELKTLGLYRLIGLMDGSTWDTYRLVASPQPDPFFLEVETPLFYIRFLKNMVLKLMQITFLLKLTVLNQTGTKANQNGITLRLWV